MNCASTIPRRIIILMAVLAIGVTLPLLAANNAPIRNWAVAPNAELGHTTFFQAITPCRLVDTRFANGSWGSPKFSAGQTRNYHIPSSPNCTGIPDAEAYSLNFTITQYSGGGFLTAWQYGATRPNVSTLNFGVGEDLGNAAVVPSTAGSISVYTWGSTHVIIDINGYFTNEALTGHQFYVPITYPGMAAIYGHNHSSTNGSHGVGGYADGTGAVHGVQGGSAGTTGSSGVHGYVYGTQGTFGVLGETNEVPGGTYPWSYSAGVGGKGYVGVAGIGTWAGVAGRYVTTGGVTGPKAYLGWSTSMGFYAEGAGYNAGNFSVGGTLSKAAGSFVIDHPLDPENKFLRHSFVESPDMMNIYNGVVELDGNGEAIVLLPAYFEALNQDFRYQLTAMGKPQPNLYIGDEILGNQFRIAGGRPFAKASWTVTGIRHDAFANAHRIQVETEKPAEERGTYLHPLEHGKGLDKGYDALMDDPVKKDAIDRRMKAEQDAFIKAMQNQ